MKFRGTSVRFVMASATVPNIQDVAAWVGHGNMSGPADVMEVITVILTLYYKLSWFDSSEKNTGHAN
jgi:hypothetical protein